LIHVSPFRRAKTLRPDREANISDQNSDCPTSRRPAPIYTLPTPFYNSGSTLTAPAISIAWTFITMMKLLTGPCLCGPVAFGVTCISLKLRYGRCRACQNRAGRFMPRTRRFQKARPMNLGRRTHRALCGYKESMEGASVECD
jgi:hypothetical protein